MTSSDQDRMKPQPGDAQWDGPGQVDSERADGGTSRTAPRLLEILVCPLTKTTLELSADRSELVSRRARLAYPIRDGIPLLTRETARELTDEDLRNL